MPDNLWVGVKPGDIGFTKGGGIVGWVIRHGTGSRYAHSFVYHKLLSRNPDGSETWETVEAYPSRDPSQDGVRVRVRTEPPTKVVRLWRSNREQEDILKKSLSMVGIRYGWGEIFRIALRMVGIKFRKWDNSSRAICSNHCTQSVLAARPSLSLFFKYEPFEIWPGELASTADAIVWLQYIADSTRRRK